MARDPEIDPTRPPDDRQRRAERAEAAVRGPGVAGAVQGVIPPAPAARGRPLTDRGAVALAAATAAGAWWHPAVPLWLGAAVAVAGLAVRRPFVLVVGVAVLAAALATRSYAGMGPAPTAPFRGTVTLVSDPEPLPFGASVDVRAGTRHVELWATGAAAGTVLTALAGERLAVWGTLHPPPPGSPWLVPRHVVGRLEVDHADRADPGTAPWRAANRFRRLLATGAASIPQPARSLYAGFVLGDDRDQPPEIVDDFRGAGLTHLLVVSGENVAFVLALVAPVVRRLGLAGRWAVTMGVIGAFGVVTRFEPSVLRASAMAALAVSATMAGRPVSTLRLVALATAGLVLVDPLLVRSVGFQLSVAASVGIALLAAPIAERVPGPRWLAEALGVTLAAQLGVAPVLVPQFGGLPVVAIAANLLAVPVAGLVTTWGLPAGVVAGVVGGPVGTLVQVPTRVLIWWVAGVARISASLPLGEVGLGGVVAAAGACGAASWCHRRASRAPGPSRAVPAARALAAAVVAFVLLSPAVALRSPPFHANVAEGADLYRSGGATVLVLDGRIRAADLLQGLRRAGVRRLDLVVAATTVGPDLVATLRHRWVVATTLDGARGPMRAAVGPLIVTVPSAGPIQVVRAPPEG